MNMYHGETERMRKGKKMGGVGNLHSQGPSQINSSLVMALGGEFNNLNPH